jgi:tetratricopeptide (TPR) repeat protein
MRRISAFCLLACACATGQQQPAPSIDRIEKQAEAARAAKRVDEAIQLYKKGVAMQPSWDEGWWALGTIYYDLDRFDEGRTAFRRLTVIKPDVGLPWAMLGLCEYEIRRYEEALQHLRHGTDLGVDQDQNISAVAHYHLALLLTRFTEYEASMKVLSAFAQRDANSPSYVEAMGIAALRKPLLPMEVPPAEHQLVMDTGRVMYDAAALHTSKAAAEFKILVGKYADTPNIHYLYGGFLLFSDADGGIEELKKELEVSPAHVPAMVTLANEYIQRKQYPDALPYAKKAAELDPLSFPALTVYGRVLVEGDVNLQLGLTELEEARKLAPSSPQVRIALATAYTKAGRKEDAAREREAFSKLRKEIDAKAAPGGK